MARLKFFKESFPLGNSTLLGALPLPLGKAVFTTPVHRGHGRVPRQLGHLP